MSRSPRRIAVIGAGVCGLSSAIRLRELGHAVRIVAQRRSPQTTSNRAGAVFTPFRVEGHAGAARWTEASHAVYRGLAGVAAGVGLARLREYFFTPLDGRPWWTEFVEGYESLAPVPAPYVDGIAATVPRMDMTRYMPWLEAQFTERLGGTIEPRTVTTFDELLAEGCEIVVNCSGLGAAELADDAAVMPMRGQVLHVANAWGWRECLVEEGRGSTTTYVFPFDDYIVLGGTYERHERREETDEVTLAAIVARCRALLRSAGYGDVPELGARRLRCWAGLRPARVQRGADEAVRLERVEHGAGRWVVHNYGHGRAGVTLSWGCAADVARLVEEVG